MKGDILYHVKNNLKVGKESYKIIPMALFYYYFILTDCSRESETFIIILQWSSLYLWKSILIIWQSEYRLFKAII